ncbi:MAG: HAMP domain-containing histidine kinase [Lachnospiraceae bacterium]|nr:HAMP domain-containing histidine kinase [Lachnospiraceae bacterium]
MKLWQKILLISLIFVLGAVETTAFIVLSRDFSMTVEREREQGVTEHNYLAATIANQVVYSRLLGDKILLSEEEIEEVIDEVLSATTVSVDGAAVFRQSDPIRIYRMDELQEMSEFQREALHSEECLTLITGEGENTRLYVTSGLTLEGTAYQLYTVTDMGDIYRDYDEQLLFVRNLGMVLAVVISAVLVAVLFTLLGPLTRLNASLRQIAGGNYSLRIKEQGSPEFRELAGNINRMSESVEENVQRISEIAESRKRFIDNLAHEMKTPLTSIMGFGDIMRIKREMSEKQRREYAEIIVEDAKRLRTLSGKLLELATNEGAELELVSVNLRELFREVHLTVAPILSRRHMTMEMASTHIAINCDRELFKSLLYNLIDNSIKASADGSKIILKAVNRDNKARISVTDFGIGMSNEQAKRVTEPFYMVDKSRSRKEGGAGLGLSLCVEVAKRHGAVLEIESQQGKGTTVFVYIDCHPEIVGSEDDEIG